MKAMAWLAALAALALLTGTAQAADKKNSELLVGKWTPGEKKEGVVIEFTKGGEVKITIGADGKGFTMTGKYKVVEEKTVEMTILDPATKADKTHKITIKSITADEMTILNPEGKEEKLKAVK